MLKKLGSIILIMISIFTFSGCNNNSTNLKGNENNEGDISNDKIIVLPYNEDVSSINPAFMQEDKVGLVGNILYDPLYSYGGEVRTYLANSVEFKDNKELIIKLRDGLKWHDGIPITSEDIKYTFDVILDESQGSPLRKFMIIGDKPIETEVIDNLTIKIKLPEERADFLHNISRIVPIPKHIYEGESNITSSSKNNSPIGSGPFKFKQWVKGKNLILEKYDDYYGGTPKVDLIEIRNYQDIKAQEKALVEEDLTFLIGGPDIKNNYINDAEFKVYPFSQGNVNCIVFNENVDAMKNIYVRKALSYGLNREDMIEAIYGDDDAVEEATSIFTPETDYYTEENVEEYNYDKEKFAEYMKRANIELQNIIIGYNIEELTHKLYAEKTKEQLEDLGISVTVSGYKSDEFFNLISSDSSECDLYVSSYKFGINPDNYKSFFMAKSFNNQSKYENINIDKLWNEAYKEVNNENRKKLYSKIQTMIMEEAPIYLIDYGRSYIIAKKSLNGVENARPTAVTIFEDWSRLSIKD